MLARVTPNLVVRPQTLLLLSRESGVRESAFASLALCAVRPPLSVHSERTHTDTTHTKIRTHTHTVAHTPSTASSPSTPSSQAVLQAPTLKPRAPSVVAPLTSLPACPALSRLCLTGRQSSIDTVRYTAHALRSRPSAALSWPPSSGIHSSSRHSSLQSPVLNTLDSTRLCALLFSSCYLTTRQAARASLGLFSLPPVCC